MLTSKVTRRSQTTLPNGVRKALALQPGIDSLHWEIRGNEAVVRRAGSESKCDDPALVPFLHLLEQDISKLPEHLRGMPEGLYHRLTTATEDVEVDLDERIEGPVAI